MHKELKYYIFIGTYFEIDQASLYENTLIRNSEIFIDQNNYSSIGVIIQSSSMNEMKGV